MTTILPEVAQRRGPFAAVGSVLPRARTAFLVVLVLVVGTAGAVGARAWTSREPDLPGPDKPGGRQVPLTTTVSLPAGPYNPAFTITLPTQPTNLNVATTPDASILSTRLNPGGPISVLLFVRFDGIGSAREAIDTVGLGEYRLGPVRKTQVAGLPAFTRDMFFGDKVVHEYRFEIAGGVYGVGVLTKVGDDVGHDTGLAAMATLRFG